MSIPVSSGIGTGAAQVYSTDKTYSAYQNSLQASKDAMAYQQRAKAMKEKEEAEAKKEKIAINQKFMKDYDVDYSKLYEADIPEIRQGVTNFIDKYKDRGEDIYSGGEYYLEAMKDWAEIEGVAANSMQRKVVHYDKAKDISLNPDKYSNNVREQFNNLAEQKLIPPSAYQSIAHDLKIPLPTEVLVDLIDDKSKSQMYKPMTSVKNDRGEFSNTGVSWLPQNERIAFIKKVGATNPVFLQSLNKYMVDNNVDEETAYKQITDGYSATNLAAESTNITNTTVKPDKPDKPDKPTLAYKTIYRQELGQNVLFLSKKNGEQVSFDYGGFVKDGKDYGLKKPIIEYVWVDKGGKIKAKVSGEDDKGGLVSGQTVDLPLSYWGQIAMGLGLQGTIGEIQDATRPSSSAVSNETNESKAEKAWNKISEDNRKILIKEGTTKDKFIKETIEKLKEGKTEEITW